jgi:hypothetical protein
MFTYLNIDIRSSGKFRPDSLAKAEICKRFVKPRTSRPDADFTIFERIAGLG